MPSPILEYNYDERRIEELDLLRHDFAHRRNEFYDIEDGKNDVKYLLNTTLHFFLLTTKKLDINGATRPTTT